MLKGYSDIDYVVSGFHNGFQLHYQGPNQSFQLSNSTSAHQHSKFLISYIARELQLGRIAGPFSSPPLDNFIVSPIAVVPKKEPGAFRVIHDLSQPTASSVNSFIPDCHARVHYETFDKVVQLVLESGFGCLLAKCDVKEGFRNLPVSPSDYHLLGFKFNNKYYYDMVMPMGARSSCNIFERFSTALQWIIFNRYNFHSVSHILDDFIFVGPSHSSECMRGLTSFICLAKFINLPLKPSKTVYPSTCVTVHGIQIDTLSMRATIPQDKITKALSLIHQFLDTGLFTLRNLQSLLGLLNFCCKCIRPGRAFLRRLWDLLSHHSSSLNAAINISLTSCAAQDLRVWCIFLQQFNGISLLSQVTWQHADKIHLFTDASKKGYAFCYGSKWFGGTWSPHFSALNILVLEFIPVVMCVEFFAECFSNKGLILHIDNLALVHVINNQTSKCSLTMRLLRKLVTRQLVSNISIHAVHITSRSNIIADLISRCRFEQARSLAPFLEKNPVQLKPELMPQSLLQDI